MIKDRLIGFILLLSISSTLGAASSAGELTLTGTYQDLYISTNADPRNVWVSNKSKSTVDVELQVSPHHDGDGSSVKLEPGVSVPFKNVTRIQGKGNTAVVRWTVL